MKKMFLTISLALLVFTLAVPGQAWANEGTIFVSFEVTDWNGNEEFDTEPCITIYDGTTPVISDYPLEMSVENTYWTAQIDITEFDLHQWECSHFLVLWNMGSYVWSPTAPVTGFLFWSNDEAGVIVETQVTWPIIP